MTQLTERQQEIKRLLDQGMGAREIAEELGVTRNAVYQQIQRMRRHGDLDPGYTPSGQPPRQQMPGADVLTRLIGANASLSDHDTAAVAASMALLNEIKYTRDQLSAIVARLSAILPS